MEYGFTHYILLRFYQPMVISLGGEEIVTEKDAYIIYPPYARQLYRPLSGGFTNDYVRFFADESFIKSYDLPLNEVLYSSNNSEPALCISMITWMLTDVMHDHGEEMAEQLKAALKSLQENMIIVSAKSFREHLRRKQFANLREQVRADPVGWTVEKMAQKVYLTRSHFYSTYKEQFGASPADDLMRFTMDRAKKLLKETPLQVYEIAEQCGYMNSNNFTRAFKKYTGVSPLKFRNGG